MSAPRRHAVVAGAGIGGLTAAVALHRRGWRVTVCERAPGPTAVGAGIVLAPNALRAFDAIGFDATRAGGRTVPAAMGLRRPDGAWLNRADTVALTARYGRPPLAVHRSALADALAAELPDGTIRYASTVTTVDDAVGAAGRPVVRTAAGDLEADLVLAADGIHSPLRRRYFPDHPGLRYSGETAWRTVLPASGHGAGADTAETWGRGQRFGTVPLADGRTYVYATAVAPEGHRPADVRAELLRRYGDWHDPIPALLERIDPTAVLQHDLYDLAAPLPRFHHGRLAWLGDAAHAMTPTSARAAARPWRTPWCSPTCWTRAPHTTHRTFRPPSPPTARPAAPAPTPSASGPAAWAGSPPSPIPSRSPSATSPSAPRRPSRRTGRWTRSSTASSSPHGGNDGGNKHVSAGDGIRC